MSYIHPVQHETREFIEDLKYSAEIGNYNAETSQFIGRLVAADVSTSEAEKAGTVHLYTPDNWLETSIGIAVSSYHRPHTFSQALLERPKAKMDSLYQQVDSATRDWLALMPNMIDTYSIQRFRPMFEVVTFPVKGFRRDHEPITIYPNRPFLLVDQRSVINRELNSNEIERIAAVAFVFDTRPIIPRRD